MSQEDLEDIQKGVNRPRKMSPPSLVDYLQISDAAIRDTINAFFRHPYGFHGDSGIQHYLYHRILTHAGTRAVFPPVWGFGQAYLLLRSEYYSKLTYQNVGVKATPGRFDMAFIDPATLPERFDIPPEKEPEAMVAFEVGKNKSAEKLGKFDSPSSERNPAPSDTAKIIRDVLAGHLKAGYVLEFYDGRNHESTASKIALQLKSYLDNKSDKIYVAIVLYNPSGEPTVWLYPEIWEEELDLPYKKLVTKPKPPTSGEKIEVKKKQGAENRITFSQFRDRCSAGVAALQDEIRRHFESRCNLIYGGKTMTVNFNGSRLLRISNSLASEGYECISDMHSQVLDDLQNGLPGVSGELNGPIRIPAERDERFNASIINAIKSTIERGVNGE